MEKFDFEVNINGEIQDLRESFQERLRRIHREAYNRNETLHRKITLTLAYLGSPIPIVQVLALFTGNPSLASQSFSINYLMLVFFAFFIYRIFSKPIRKLFLKPYIRTLLDEEFEREFDKQIMKQEVKDNIMDNIEDYSANFLDDGDFLDDGNFPDF